MNGIKAIFTKRIERSTTIVSFRFKPEGKVNFLPGQFLKLIFDKSDLANRDLNKYLSCSTSPTKDYLEVTKRLSQSEFSQSLERLLPQDEVLLAGPFGHCLFEDNLNKIAFLIGGIGITPVISMLDYIAVKNLNTEVVLFYSNKKEEDIAFKSELDNWAKNNQNIKIYFFVTECKAPESNCISGRINKDELKSRVKDWDQRIVFIFGPPKMVEAMKDICLEAGCVKENVKTEGFTGY